MERSSFFHPIPTPNHLFVPAQKPAIDNYLRLRELYPLGENVDTKRTASLDSHNFPSVLAATSLKMDSANIIKYRESLCHRCNMATPSLAYCHSMYGTRFVQNFGWYINQAYYRYGIEPLTLNFVEDSCSSNFKDMIHEIIDRRQKYYPHNQNLRHLINDNPSQRIAILDKNRDMARELRQAERRLSKIIENEVRKEFGFKKVGEAWLGETLLFYIVERIFTGEEVIFHYRPDWLTGLEIDVYVPSRKIGFEYQGQQHYRAIKIWGGEKALAQTIQRDKKKAQICRKMGIRLLKIKYTEPLSEDYVRNLLT